jgi:hypothetical protein
MPEPPSARDVPAVIHLGPPPAAPVKSRHGSEKRQRRAGILVKLTPADHQRVKAEAAAMGMSAAGYLASGRLNGEAAKRPRVSRRQAAVNEAALLRALVAFNRANNNLNQVAHTGNVLMLFAEERGAERLAEEARQMARAVEALRRDMDRPIAAILAALSGDSEG